MQLRNMLIKEKDKFGEKISICIDLLKDFTKEINQEDGCNQGLQKYRIPGELTNLRSTQQVCWMKVEGGEGEGRRGSFPI